MNSQHFSLSKHWTKARTFSFLTSLTDTNTSMCQLIQAAAFAWLKSQGEGNKNSQHGFSCENLHIDAPDAIFIPKQLWFCQRAGYCCMFKVTGEQWCVPSAVKCRFLQWMDFSHIGPGALVTLLTDDCKGMTSLFTAFLLIPEQQLWLILVLVWYTCSHVPRTVVKDVQKRKTWVI